MLSQHRVTIRVTKLDGHKGTLSSSRIVYADDTEDIINPLDNVLDTFLIDAETPGSTTKSKKK